MLNDIRCRIIFKASHHKHVLLIWFHYTCKWYWSLQISLLNPNVFIHVIHLCLEESWRHCTFRVFMVKTSHHKKIVREDNWHVTVASIFQITAEWEMCWSLDIAHEGWAWWCTVKVVTPSGDKDLVSKLESACIFETTFETTILFIFMTLPFICAEIIVKHKRLVANDINSRIWIRFWLFFFWL